MSVTYKAIDPESGIRWCVRMVFIGDQYGLNHCLTYGDREYDQDKHVDPLIEFYDMDSGAAAIMRNSGDKTEAYLAEEYGQFVSRYYYSTLMGEDEWSNSSRHRLILAGLNLDGGVDRWSVSSEFMVDAMAAINKEMEERRELQHDYA